MIMTLDRALSEESARGRARPKLRQCYYNAFRAWTKAPFYDALYVEGVLADTLTFEHGWLELDGKVIDPTAILRPPLDLNRAPAYFPVLRFTHEEFFKTLRLPPRPDSLPLFTRFKEDSEEIKRWRATQQEAWAYIVGPEQADKMNALLARTLAE